MPTKSAESTTATNAAETTSAESTAESTTLTTVAETTATIGAMTAQTAAIIDTNGAQAMDLEQDDKVGYELWCSSLSSPSAAVCPFLILNPSAL